MTAKSPDDVWAELLDVPGFEWLSRYVMIAHRGPEGTCAFCGEPCGSSDTSECCGQSTAALSWGGIEALARECDRVVADAPEGCATVEFTQPMVCALVGAIVSRLRASGAGGRLLEDHYHALRMLREGRRPPQFEPPSMEHRVDLRSGIMGEAAAVLQLAVSAGKPADDWGRKIAAALESAGFCSPSGGGKAAYTSRAVRNWREGCLTRGASPRMQEAYDGLFSWIRGGCPDCCLVELVERCRSYYPRHVILEN